MQEQLKDIIRSYRLKKGKYDFFDINCWLCFPAQNTFYPPENMEEYLSELEKNEIKKAVITNFECTIYNPLSGNKNLIRWIKGYKNLYGGIVWTPEIGFPGNDLYDYIDEMIKNKVVLVRMFPKLFKHSMKKWQIGDILEYMEHKKLPLLLWHMQTDWDAIQEICTEYSELPIIIEGNDQELLFHNRSYIRLLQKYENLYLETHNLILGIEYLVNEIGIDRLLFGTFFPYNDPDAAIMMITDSDVSEDKKYKIANENLCNLIKNIRK